MTSISTVKHGETNDSSLFFITNRQCHTNETESSGHGRKWSQISF